MKTVKKENVSYYDVFVADDGKEFKDKLECEKYEKTAQFATEAQYHELIVKTSDEAELFHVGCSDNPIEIVRVKSDGDAHRILKMFYLRNPYLRDMEEEKLKEDAFVKQALERIHRAQEDNDYLLIWRGYEMDDFIIIGTRLLCIERFNEVFNHLTPENA